LRANSSPAVARRFAVARVAFFNFFQKLVRNKCAEPRSRSRYFIVYLRDRLARDSRTPLRARGTVTSPLSQNARILRENRRSKLNAAFGARPGSNEALGG